VSEAGLLTFQCQTLHRRPTTASNAIPATKTSTKPGSGTTRISCAFSIFVFTDFIGLFRPALFLHPRMIHPLDP